MLIQCRDPHYYGAACLDLASKHGVRAARRRLLFHPHCAALAIERFDRSPGGGRLLVQSLASLLGDDFRVPKPDYRSLAQVSSKRTGKPEAERIFRQACFNVAMSMRDDHSKNFAFRIDAESKWELSPAFDLCPSPGPCGWHTMTIFGTGIGIGRTHLLKFAQSLGLPKATAKEGIDQALAAPSEFEALAIALGSQKTGAIMWAKTFRSIARELAPVLVAAGHSGAATAPKHGKIIRGQQPQP